MTPSESKLDDPTVPAHDAARVRILYRLAPRSLAISLLIAGVTALTLWQETRLVALWWWVGALVAVSAGRLALYFRFRAAPGTLAQPLAWERAYAAGAGAMGITWAWLAFIGPLPPVYEVLVVFVIGGMAMGSAGVLGASVLSFACFVSPLLAAQIGELVYLGGSLYHAMAVMAVLFTVGLASAFVEFRRALLTSLSVQRELELLHREQRLIFENATVGVAFNRDRRILDCNPQFAAMLGWRPEEINGSSMREHYADDAIWEEIGREGYEMLRGGQPYRREIRFRRRDGSLMVADATMQSLMPGEPGKGVVVILNDITQAREREAALRQALLEQVAIVNTAPVGILFVQDRVVMSCNDFACALMGRPAADIVGRTTETWYASRELWERHGRDTYAAFSRGERISFEEEFRRADGSRFWCHVQGGAVDPADPVHGPAVFVLADTSDRKRAEAAVRESREQMVLVIRAAQSGIFDYDLTTEEITFSGKFCEILGYSVTTDASVIMPMVGRLHPEDRERMLAVFRNHILKRKPIDEEFRLRRADGSYVWVRGTGQATWNSAGRATRFVGSINDISESKRQEERIRRLALEDPLTGLPNRRLLEDRLARAMALATREGQLTALLLIDLDGFKAVNDSHGHAAGDVVLQGVADVLRRTVRDSDTVARIGGDEFVVLAGGLTQREDADRLADKIADGLGQPVGGGEYRFNVGASIGIAVFPADATDADGLLKHADRAMYAVKHGRGGRRPAPAGRPAAQ